MMVVDVVIILAMLIMKDSSSQDKQLQNKMVVVTKKTMTKIFFLRLCALLSIRQGVVRLRRQLRRLLLVLPPQRHDR